jgi:hypothetical protein
MRSFKKAFNKNDELYTPPVLVDVIVPFLLDWYKHTCIKEGVKPFKYDYILDPKTVKEYRPIIWCPFDTEDSEFVIRFKELGFDVVYSHIDTGQDFFEYEPENWDIAISNCPFSCKLAVFQRLNKLGKPWIMAMNMMAINYSEIGNYFADNPVALIIPDKKISFDGNTSSFCTGYVTRWFLPDETVKFVHVPHNNTGVNFTPSRMYK